MDNIIFQYTLKSCCFNHLGDTVTLKKDMEIKQNEWRHNLPYLKYKDVRK